MCNACAVFGQVCYDGFFDLLNIMSLIAIVVAVCLVIGVFVGAFADQESLGWAIFGVFFALISFILLSIIAKDPIGGPLIFWAVIVASPVALLIIAVGAGVAAAFKAPQPKKELKTLDEVQCIYYTENTKILVNQSRDGVFSFTVYLFVNEFNKLPYAEFQAVCERLGGRAITANIHYNQQIFFRKNTEHSSFFDVLENVREFKSVLSTEGFTVIREKIAIPSVQYDDFKQQGFIEEIDDTLESNMKYFEWRGYYEHSIPFSFYSDRSLGTFQNKHQIVPGNTYKIKNIEKNFFLMQKNESEYEYFKQVVEVFINTIHKKQQGFFTKIDAEYCVYDMTEESHS